MSPSVRSTQGVLVLDSDPATRSLLRTFLGEAGFTVHAASSTTQALDQCRKLAPALALAEVDLASAAEQTFLLQMKKTCPSLRICVMCASGQVYSPADLASLGIAHFFSKPFALNRLIEVFHRLLDPSKQCPGDSSVGFD